MELTILMPCLNEEETIEICIVKALKAIRENDLVAEILIADNGSTDNSILISEHLGARVVHVSEKGYGAALLKGIKEAKGKYIIMADSDDSYNFQEFMPLLEKLRQGFDLVMGNRFKGGIMSGAMPFLHRYLGNPVLSFLGRTFYNVKVNDFHCGYRGFKKENMSRLGLKCRGMDFASEMIVKSELAGLTICEVPVKLYRDGRSRAPHLQTWTDGWRHLRFLLLLSPKWLFLYPGFALLFFGLILGTLFFILPEHLDTVSTALKYTIYCVGLFLIGFQMIVFYVFVCQISFYNGTLKRPVWYLKFDQLFKLERGLILGGSIFFIGALLTYYSVLTLESISAGNIYNIFFPALLLILGIIIVINCFFLSLFKHHQLESTVS